jgi:DNA primase
MDEAGRKAALRAIDIINAEKGKSRVIKLRGAKDPDEYINKYGVEAFSDALKNAVPSTEFRLSLIKGKYDTSQTDDKIKFVNEAAAALVGISDAVEVDAYIRKLSEENDISADAVYSVLKSKTDGSKGKQMPVIRRFSNKAKDEGEKSVPTALIGAERRLLSLIAGKKQLYRLAAEYIKPEEYSTDIHRKLAKKNIFAL